MARCTNCGSETPDNAAFCPSCGKPNPSKREGLNLVQNGAILGLIGYAGLILVGGLVALIYTFGEPSQPQGFGETLASMQSDLAVEQMIQDAMPFLIFGALILMAGLVCFIVGLARANKLGRPGLIAISSICLATSLATLVAVFAWMNIMLLCMGWLIGWQPILMTLGAFKMLNASLKIPK